MGKRHKQNGVPALTAVPAHVSVGEGATGGETWCWSGGPSSGKGRSAARQPWAAGGARSLSGPRLAAFPASASAQPPGRLSISARVWCPGTGRALGAEPWPRVTRTAPGGAWLPATGEATHRPTDSRQREPAPPPPTPGTSSTCAVRRDFAASAPLLQVTRFGVPGSPSWSWRGKQMCWHIFPTSVSFFGCLIYSFLMHVV